MKVVLATLMRPCCRPLQELGAVSKCAQRRHMEYCKSCPGLRSA